MKLEDEGVDRVDVDVVDLALLVLGKEDEDDGDELAGNEDELLGAELLGVILDDTLETEEVSIELLKDEEATIGMFKEDELAELLEMMGEIDVLTLSIMSVELFP